MADTLQDLQHIHEDKHLEPYEATIKKWETQLSCICFIYDSIIEDRKKILSWLNVMSFISSSLAGVTSLLNLATNRPLGLMITTALVISVTVGCNAAMNILKYDTFISSAELYYNKAERFLAEIVARESVPEGKLRQNAVKFVEKNNKRYMLVLTEAPNLPNTAYEKYRDKFFSHLAKANDHSHGSSESKRKWFKFT